MKKNAKTLAGIKSVPESPARRRCAEPYPSPVAHGVGAENFQHALGNQAVLRLLRSGALQAKLTISRPDDIYEQEADRVADEVMRMPDAAVARQTAAINGAGVSIQTKPG